MKEAPQGANTQNPEEEVLSVSAKTLRGSKKSVLEFQTSKISEAWRLQPPSAVTEMILMGTKGNRKEHVLVPYSFIQSLSCQPLRPLASKGEMQLCERQQSSDFHLSRNSCVARSIMCPSSLILGVEQLCVAGLLGCWALL
jgi:hypothetical protein